MLLDERVDDRARLYVPYFACGILANGCARTRCEDCGHTALIALRYTATRF